MKEQDQDDMDDFNEEFLDDSMELQESNTISGTAKGSPNVKQNQSKLLKTSNLNTSD